MTTGFQQSTSMDDVSLKPRMLRSLIKQYVPDEKPALNFNITLQLPKLVSIIQTHRLLSESSTQSMDQKLIDSWKSAVDDWVNRFLLLLSSDMSDKCWVGICLLGVTCQQCTSDRFLMFYHEWFNKLLFHIQPSADSQLVKVAACTSMSDLLTRLARFPEVKKGANDLAGKVTQLVLKLLNDSVEAICDGAASLTYTIITFFPTSIRPYYDGVEAAIASKILSGKFSTKTLEKLAYCLALLPKSKGDEDSWYIMMQKILLSINDHLNDAFQGVEEESKADEAKRLLVPPGKDLPPPLGHTSLLQATRSSETMPTSIVTTLLFCSCKMLTSSYPVQVNAPVREMLAVVERLLMVDGSLPHTMLPFMTAMQQELICSELPVLHAYSLDLLIAIIKGMRSQLLPHAAYIVRLLTRYFRRCALPELRIKLYSISRMLLISMGVGMAIYLAPEVIDNAFNDLNIVGDDDAETLLAKIAPSTGALPQPSIRKRKRGTKIGSLEDKQDTTDSEVGAPNTYQTTAITVKIAALDTLEFLLTVGGASKSEGWRSSIDSLLINTAIYSCKRGWGNEENNIFLHNESTLMWADFQLSSLRALLASFLAPARVRPPYLAQGLELFRKGKQEAGTKLAGFCSYALLALEVLIHPRALPLDDFPSTYRTSADGADHISLETIYSGGKKHDNMIFNSKQGTKQGALSSNDDDLHDWLLENENENIPFQNMNKEVSGFNLAEEPRINDSSSTDILEVSKQKAPADEDVVMRSKDEMIAQALHSQELLPQSREILSAKDILSPAVPRKPEDTKIESEKVLSAGDVVTHTNHDTPSLDEVIADKGNVSYNIHGSTSQVFSNAEKGNSSMARVYSDSSMDSFPSIVDADPDTDSD
ncbi:Armadillo-like helical [Corchorus olitorius]|uniref:Armadillo-like helical n=1 Tax=Corchorus olitorius TaxID=93759 RepID=A0A1R3HHY4_9ROSI|nr:Armadillo-like helical [Corchorus olitorius]